MAVPEWNPDDKTPYVYARLADHIQARIEAGDYPPGAMLPNEREMVPKYGVSIDTVRRALAELRKRGLVVTYPSRGTFAAERLESAGVHPGMPAAAQDRTGRPAYGRGA
jgi:GntR family transcriptional regulator